MSYALGTASGKIVLDYDGSGVDAAKKDVDGLEKGSSKTKDSLNKLANVSGIAGGAIAAGLAAGVNAAADFEQRMSAIQAVSGATGSEMDKIKDKALQLGKDTQFSASEAGQAIEELIKAGISVPDVMNGAADSVVALAAAGEVDMPTAATIAANAMNQFGIKAKDMNGVVDNIAGAANASAIDVTDFGTSLQQVGAVANLSGVDFKDTATAIALMGNAGIKGSDAGTSLKSMLSRLQPQTKKQALEMERLGILTKDGSSRFYDAQGNMKSLAQVSGILQKSLKGQTAEQKQAALQTLFGSDAIRAAAILTKNGSKGFDKMAASMGKVKAADVAKTRMDNFKGSLEQMKGSLETAGIAVGTALLPPLRKLVDIATGLLNKFLNLSDGTQKWIIGIIAAVGAVLLIIATVIKITLFIQKFVEVLKILKLAFAETWIAALGPIALIIAAIAAIVAIFVILYKKNETFRNLVNKVWAAVKKAIGAVADWITGKLVPMLAKAWNNIKGPLIALFKLWKAYWGLIWAIVKLAFAIIKLLILGGIKIVKDVIGAALGFIKKIWGKLWNSLPGNVQENIKNIITKIGNLKDKVVGFFKNAGTWLVDAGKKIIQGLIDGITKMIGKVTKKIEEVTDKISKFIPGSPVREGPLKVLNRGHSGKQIVQMLIDGFDSMSPELKSTLSDVTGMMGNHLTASPLSGVAGHVVNHGSSDRVLNLTVPVHNPAPEPVSQSVDKVLRTKIEAQGWSV